jgi:phosphoglycolate phosphatase
MKKYKHLLFDLDGTLADPSEGITKCIAYALEHFGIQTIR